MACVTNEQTVGRVDQPTQSRAFEWLAHLLRGLAVRLARPDRLDLEGMPDRVKRDLGFMDGREPYIEDARAR
ncbi:hypothetical protein QTL95_23790 [Rhizobium sp. S152]|uniref:hypothetical protein n=1 Tax=Rhizobium sp. S152 TaxID=3055038 RepID=UPI0025AA137B|nr:hypothetical protein [Rhizobium sp. S152]MDM9628924.1 hypothetical protein [Rhizobium sp. S152]